MPRLIAGRRSPAAMGTALVIGAPDRAVSGVSKGDFRLLANAAYIAILLYSSRYYIHNM